MDPNIYTSVPLFGGVLTSQVDRTPLTLDEATHSLYNRAITNPSSLTDEERTIITHRPSQEEEDRLCRNACGLSMSELVTKAIENRDLLTYNEARLLTAGVIPGQAGRLLSERARLSAADRDLTHRAQAAATTEGIKAAQAHARAVTQRWNKAHSAALEFLNNDDLQNIKYALRVPWQDHVLSLTGTAVCGLVAFYLGVPEWVSFKEQIKTAIYHGMHYSPGSMNEAAVAKFTLQWDSFLYVDEESLRSRDARRAFVWLWEPEKETAEPLKVDIKHIAPTLFARLTQRDLSPEKARSWPYRHTSELEMLRKAAGHSRMMVEENNGESVYALNRDDSKDGIWPPPARYQ